MASTTRHRGKQSSTLKQKTKSLRKKIVSYWREFSILKLLNDPESSWIIAALLLILELFVTYIVIENIPYTEIDWKAYMQEVEGVVNGTLDYRELKGDTGPLVYPAGFVYTFYLLYVLTEKGTNIYAAQYMFAVLYLLTLVLVFRLYKRTKRVPPYALVFMCCTSYRIHSIYVLRLFNDPVAIFFFFWAVNCFISNKWTIGCVLYSFAVSVKMNILLFAPGLLFLLLAIKGFYGTLTKIAWCAIVQVIVGLPFLFVNPISYISRAFNIGRVFLYEWTVNWRLLPEEIFLSRNFHLTLLLLHIAVICLFFYKWRKHLGSRTSFMLNVPKSFIIVDDVLLVLFTANFIGMVFCRSLHYQFYVWYFFTLPYVLWSTPYIPTVKLCLLGILELAWNTYPSTFLSSLLMNCCHLVILFGLYRNYSKTSKTTDSKKR